MYSIVLLLFSLIFGSYAMAMEPMEIDTERELSELIPNKDAWDLYILPFKNKETGLLEADPVNFAQEYDPIVNKPLSKLLTAAQQKNRDFILARVIINEEGKDVVHYYELSSLHTILFEGHIRPKNPDIFNQDIVTINTKHINIKTLQYFIYNPTTQLFDYFGNYTILLEEKNLPHEIIQASYKLMGESIRADLLYKISKTYHNQEDTAHAMIYGERAVALNQPAACAMMGYLNIRSKPANNQKACEYLQKGVTLGNPRAMTLLAGLYISVPEMYDTKAVFSLLYRAANLQNPEAMYGLGAMFARGLVTGKADFVSALDWYGKILTEPNATERDKQRAQKAIDLVKARIASEKK